MFKGTGKGITSASMMMDQCKGMDVFTEGLMNIYKLLADDGHLGRSFTQNYAIALAMVHRTHFFACDFNDNVVTVDMISHKEATGLKEYRNMISKSCRMANVLVRVTKVTAWKPKDEHAWKARLKFDIIKVYLYSDVENESAKLSEDLGKTFQPNHGATDVSESMVTAARGTLQELKSNKDIKKELEKLFKDTKGKKKSSKKPADTETEVESEDETVKRRNRKRKKIAKAVESSSEDEAPKTKRKTKKKAVVAVASSDDESGDDAPPPPKKKSKNKDKKEKEPPQYDTEGFVDDEDAPMVAAKEKRVKIPKHVKEYIDDQAGEARPGMNESYDSDDE